MKQTEIRAQWEHAAPGWAKWEDKMAGLTEPATLAMLEMAVIDAGAKVLDLACGAGSQTLSTAKLVGPEGHVVASDISENMLREVSRNAAAAQLENISTLQSAAEEIELPAESFDAVICRMGIMLFSEPARAVSKAWQVLKPGGRLSVLVFTVPQANPFMAKPMQILLKHTGKHPPAPGQPGIFSLGAPGVIDRLYADNGFKDIEKRTFSLSLKMGSADESLTMMQEAFGAYRAVLADSPESVRTAAWAEVKEMLRGFETSQGFEAPMEVLVVAGSKHG